MKTNEELYQAYYELHLHYQDVSMNYLKMAQSLRNIPIIPEPAGMREERELMEEVRKEQRERDIAHILRATEEQTPAFRNRKPFQRVKPIPLSPNTDAAIKKIVRKGRKPGAKNKPKGKVPVEAIEAGIAQLITERDQPKKRGRKPGTKDAVPRKYNGRPAAKNQEVLTPFQQAKKQFEEENGRKPTSEELLTIANRFAKP